ncbi:GTP cyclohydrolase FolE2 [Thermospira aquatica]|uniref:GTP cyclohydrolase FolE2 n=1 Tax=Thermospira aquatica TaxID=2828656 RepID=A0AAX3BBU5_9SPIR|nr:GTP cyclohydrolase FolE2 [Thermospira aquatica]URA09793.1 GTP cyclohydrolase I FolE2 [Thermospira aquatica]
MKDVQNERDERNIPINKVGIRGLRIPIVVRDQSQQRQATIADVNMYVNLPHHYRGTHMSRFGEILHRYAHDLSLEHLESILTEMKQRFECEEAHIEISFPYFIMKSAPVSGMQSYMEYRCSVQASLGENLSLTMGVEVPIHSLCPCSKEISSYGAHNQRGIVRIQAQTKGFVWFEELISLAEKQASAPLFTILKRSDEKYITEKAYTNAKFVEDTARDIALALNRDERILWYHIEVENEESIHNHNAYACIMRNKTDED